MSPDRPAVGEGLAARSHLFLTYEGPRERDRALCRFLDEGRAANETMVFVHSFQDNREALDRVVALRPAAGEWVGRQLFLLRLHQEAFEVDRRIDYAHVSRQLAEIEALSLAHGRAGARLFVDASHPYLEQGREEEWFAFEAWLGPVLRERMALVCAYRWEDLQAPERMARALAAHAGRYSE